MSTSFTLMSDPQMETTIALRFWGGSINRCTVRFTFPEVLLPHLIDVELAGENGATETVRSLLAQAETVDFLSADCSLEEHLAFGTAGAREQARLAWEAQ